MSNDRLGQTSIKYQTVAAGQTATAIGTAGSKGDIIHRIVIIPATVSPGAVALLDGTTSINIYAGGANSLLELRPIVIELNTRSGSTTGWHLTTGTAVSAIVIGYYS